MTDNVLKFIYAVSLNQPTILYTNSYMWDEETDWSHFLDIFIFEIETMSRPAIQKYAASIGLLFLKLSANK